MIDCHIAHLLARCRERGYTLEEATPCIVSRHGEQITVDIGHPAYPRTPKPGFVPPPVMPAPANLPTLEEQSPHGPGTFLSKTLEKIGIKSSPTCSCKARARTMNEKGNDWCEENLDTIVGWLREEATKRKLPFVDFAGKLLVKRAIKLSRAALAKAEQQCDAPDTPPLDSDSQAGAG